MNCSKFGVHTEATRCSKVLLALQAHGCHMQQSCTDVTLIRWMSMLSRFILQVPITVSHHSSQGWWALHTIPLCLHLHFHSLTSYMARLCWNNRTCTTSCPITYVQYCGILHTIYSNTSPSLHLSHFSILWCVWRQRHCLTALCESGHAPMNDVITGGMCRLDQYVSLRGCRRKIGWHFLINNDNLV